MARNECYLNHPSCCLQDKHLVYISEHCIKRRKELLRKLLVKNHIIEEICEDNVNNSREQAYQGLLHWQQSDPKKAAFCVLVKALDEIDRNDIKLGLEENYGLNCYSGKDGGEFVNITTTIPNFYGKEKEIDIIRNFISKEQKESPLCVVCGMPGVGKTETVNQALKGADKNKIIRPDFTIRGQRKEWELEDILLAIVTKWSLVKNKDFSGEIITLETLCKESEEGDILFLEFGHINIDASQFHRHINHVLRSSEFKLKIITTLSTHLPQLNDDSINQTIVNLKNLSDKDADSMLKEINDKLSIDQRKVIFKFSGGNPSIIKKIGRKTKSLTTENLKSYVKEFSSSHLSTLISNTLWLNDMKNWLSSLERLERLALIHMTAFSCNAPRFTLKRLCVDTVFIDHLVDSHNAIDRISMDYGVTAYFLNDLYKTFIRYYILPHQEELILPQDEYEFLKEQLEEMEFKLTQYYLTFLKHLTYAFFCSPTKDISNNKYCIGFFQCYRECSDYCKKCKKTCKCQNSMIAIFCNLQFKTALINTLQNAFASEKYRDDAVKTLSKSCHFLKYCYSKKEIRSLFNKLFPIKNLLSFDWIHQAVIFANLVFIEINGDSRIYANEYVDILVKVISFFEKELVKKKLEDYQLECMYECYSKLAYLKRVYLDLEVNDKEIKNLDRQEFDSLKKKGRFCHYGVIADIFSYETNYEDSLKYRLEQKQIYDKCYGTHPMTANVLYLLGKVCENKGDTEEALKNYKLCKAMYKSLSFKLDGYTKCKTAINKIESKTTDSADGSKEHQEEDQALSTDFGESPRSPAVYLSKDVFRRLNSKEKIESSDDLPKSNLISWFFHKVLVPLC